MKYASVISLFFLLVVSIDQAQSYDVVDVSNGATLSGTVNFKGSTPPEEMITIDRDVDYCSKTQTSDKYAVSDSMVKNAIVWLDGIEKGKAFSDRSVDVAIRNCKIQPLVNVGFVGGEYVLINEDEILHTIQLKLGLAYQKEVSGRPVTDGATIYNLALPVKDLQIAKSIKKYHRYTKDTGFVQVRSNTHNWMRGYIFIFDHPYATVTDERGNFTLDNILPGKYLLKSWHEGFGMQEKWISVSANGRVEETIAFGK